METIGTALVKSDKAQSQILLQDDLRKADVVKRFGQLDEVLIRYAPTSQIEITSNLDQCLLGDYPTLQDLNAYGNLVAGAWLLPQLYDLSEFCGCKGKLEGMVLEQCADVIVSEYGWLKVSEIMLFMRRFKAGYYGEFYGSIDALKITCSIRRFIKERETLYDRCINKPREGKYGAISEKGISYAEYCKRIGRNPTTPLAQILSKDAPKKREETKDVLEIAKSIMQGNDDNETKRKMADFFTRKYGISPKEYIEKNNSHN